MANRTPEQDLIDAFVAALHAHDDERLAIGQLRNSNCKAKHHADIEFHSKSGIHWVIEAKSHDSKDKHNTVHKIFLVSFSKRQDGQIAQLASSLS